VSTPILVLAYHQFDNFKEFIKGFLKSSLAGSSNVWVVENYSVNTQKLFEPYIKNLVDRKLIYKYVLFHKNIANSAVQIVLDEFRDELFAEEFLIISDADLTFNWVQSHYESLSILKCHPENDFCSLRLNYSNLPVAKFKNTSEWIPNYIPSCCHFKGHGGIHFAHFRTSNLKNYVRDAMANGQPFLDSEVNRYLICNHFTPCTTRTNTAIHLTWNDYNYSTEYFREKENLPSDLWTKFKCSSFDLHE